MAKSHKFDTIESLLDLRVTHFEARLSQEKRKNDALRERQLAIVEQKESLASKASETCATDPSVFAYQQSRQRKLSRDLDELQPALAQAAIGRLAAEEKVQSALRTRLGVRNHLAKSDVSPTQEDAELQQLAALYAFARQLS